MVRRGRRPSFGPDEIARLLGAQCGRLAMTA
jgi:hypothetical protein